MKIQQPLLTVEEFCEIVLRARGVACPACKQPRGVPCLDGPTSQLLPEDGCCVERLWEYEEYERVN
jgi:hypothetical protein